MIRHAFTCRLVSGTKRRLAWRAEDEGIPLRQMIYKYLANLLEQVQIADSFESEARVQPGLTVTLDPERTEAAQPNRTETQTLS